MTKLKMISRLESRMDNLYKRKVNEMTELKNAPGDSLIKHHQISLKASEMLGVSECLNIVSEFKRCYWRDLND